MSLNFSVHPKAVKDQFNGEKKPQTTTTKKPKQRHLSFYISIAYSYDVYVIQDFKNSL